MSQTGPRHCGRWLTVLTVLRRGFTCILIRPSPRSTFATEGIFNPRFVRSQFPPAPPRLKARRRDAARSSASRY